LRVGNAYGFLACIFSMHWSKEEVYELPNKAVGKIEVIGPKHPRRVETNIREIGQNKNHKWNIR
jgi:hypothetical protein